MICTGTNSCYRDSAGIMVEETLLVFSLIWIWTC